MNLLTRLHHAITKFTLQEHLADQTILVAVSGGADSLCLLHLLREAAPTLKAAVHVATLDHGMRGEASRADAAYVQAIAEAWGLPCHIASEDTAAISEKYQMGTEEAARRIRYTFLADVAARIGAKSVVVAHHADDQAETILLHLMRGAGLAGLRGMAPVTDLSADHVLPDTPAPENMVIVRPLLDVSRSDIEAYCAEHALQPRHDYTNDQINYTRNRIRHELLPMLNTFNPNIAATLARTGHSLGYDYTQLTELVDDLRQKTIVEQTSTQMTFTLNNLRSEGTASTLRHLVRQVHATMSTQPYLSHANTDRAVELLTRGTTGHSCHLGSNVTLNIEHDHATFFSAPSGYLPPNDWPQMHGETPLTIIPEKTYAISGTAWLLTSSWLDSEQLHDIDYKNITHGALLSIPENAQLTLRTRQPGDRFQPQGLDGHAQKLKKTLNSMNIPAELRQFLPILIINGEIACIFAGKLSRIAEPFTINQYHHNALLIQWLLSAQ